MNYVRKKKTFKELNSLLISVFVPVIAIDLIEKKFTQNMIFRIASFHIIQQ